MCAAHLRDPPWQLTRELASSARTSGLANVCIHTHVHDDCAASLPNLASSIADPISSMFWKYSVPRVTSRCGDDDDDIPGSWVWHLCKGPTPHTPWGCQYCHLAQDPIFGPRRRRPTFCQVAPSSVKAKWHPSDRVVGDLLEGYGTWPKSLAGVRKLAEGWGAGCVRSTTQGVASFWAAESREGGARDVWMC